MPQSILLSRPTPTLTACLLILVLAAPCTAEDVWLWLVAGQSNAPGLAETNDGRTPLTDHLRAQFPNQRHVLVVHGDGGTSLDPDFRRFGPSWHPSLMDGNNDQNDSSLFRLLDKWRTEVANVSNAGDQAILKGLFWMQGYQDAKSGGTRPTQPQAANNYGTRLRALLARIRVETGHARLPVVIGETAVGPNPSFGAAAYASTIQAHQADIAAEDDATYLAETSLNQLDTDDTHFSPDGHYQLAADMVAFFRTRRRLIIRHPLPGLNWRSEPASQAYDDWPRDRSIFDQLDRDRAFIFSLHSIANADG